jgi:ubiquinone/menaquinone biosynthesis C-methylase UbiE
MTHAFSRQVGAYYDRITGVTRSMYDENIHYGYWPDPSAACSVTEAIENMTDQLIERLDVHRGQQVLDVGCGFGAPALRLARSTGAVVVGIDVSRNHVDGANANARAVELSDQVSFEYGDAMDLPFADGSFDRVWALESMVHMPDRGQVLREMARVLRPGGQLAIADIVLREETPDEAAAETVEKWCALTNSRSLERIDTYPALVEKAGLELLDITDVSAHTRRMGVEVLDRLRAAPESVVKMIGEEVFTEQLATREAMSMLPQSGYVLLSARKP